MLTLPELALQHITKKGIIMSLMTMDKTKELISKGAINYIKNKNHRLFISTYLIPLISFRVDEEGIDSDSISSSFFSCTFIHTF